MIRIGSVRRTALLAILHGVLAPTMAYASCATPSGAAGEIVYNADFSVLQYCDGTNWIGMGGSSGGASLSDGNKGDVTVSGAGATWTINSGAVQYGKIQNVGAGSLLGRYAATNGSMQEITLGSGLSLNSTTGVLSATGALGGSGAAGYVPYWSSATALAYDNTAGGQFFWDAANHRLGLGTTTPNATLDVHGSSINGNAVLLTAGDGSSETDSSQIRFGYNGTATYMHSIRTRHNSGGAVGNAIDFWLWNYGVDAATDLGSKRVMTLQGDGKVGIGTIPVDMLNVNGSVALGWDYAANIPTSPNARQLYGVGDSGILTTAAGATTYYLDDLTLKAQGHESGAWYPASSDLTSVLKGGDLNLFAGDANDTGNNGTRTATYTGGDINFYPGTAKHGSATAYNPQINYGNINFYTPTGASRADASWTRFMTIDGGSYSTTSNTKNAPYLAITGGNVGIGTSSPNASALLDVASTSSGLLPPRMTNAQVTAIASPAEGLLAYDTTNHALMVRTNSAWVTLANSASAASSGTAGYVQYSGGAGAFASDSTSGGQFFWDSTNHRLGIGTASPTYPLQVSGSAGTAWNMGVALFETSGPDGSIILNNTGTGGAKWGLNSTATGSGLGAGKFAISDITNGAGRFVITPEGNIGIGTAAPSARLHVYNATSLTSGNNYDMYISGSQSVATTGVTYGLVSAPSIAAASGTTSAVIGIQANPQNTGAGTVSGIYGISVAPNNTSSGPVGSMFGITAQPQKSGTGAVTNMYGVLSQCRNANATGVVTNCYGLYLSPPDTTGAITNSYGLYQADAASENYLAGNLGIGTASPAEPLEVQGTVNSTAIYSNPMQKWSVPGIPSVKNSNSAGISVGSFETGISGRSRMDFSVAGSPAAANNWGLIPDVTVMTLNANGNVGIGTTSPNEPLEVASTNARMVVSDGQGANRRGLLLVAPTTGNDYGRIEAYDYGAGAGKPLLINQVGGGGVSIGAGVPDSETALQVISTTKGVLLPRMTNAQVLAITTPADGLLAYDTTNHKLMYSNSGAWTNVSSGGGSSSGTAGYVQLSDGSGAFASDSTSGGQFFWDSTNHRLGIGTTSPDTQLQATSGAHINKVIVGTNASSGTDMAYAYEAVGVTAGNMRVESPNNIYFHTGMTTSEADDASKIRMTISTTGRVGIGTTNPSAPLTISDTSSAATGGEEYGLLLNKSYSVADTSLKQGIRSNAAATNTSGTLSSLVSVLSLASSSGNGGSTSSQYTYWARNDVGTGATVDSAYGLYVTNGTGAGTMNNQYGVYVGSLTKGASNYAIYTAGTTPSYFGGNVGIGTTSPASMLQVGTTTSSTKSAIATMGEAISAGLALPLSLVNSATAAANNEVGMSFHLAGNYSATGRVRNVLTSTSPILADLAFDTFNSGSGSLSEKMRITGAGNVGIGTSSPQKKLHVEQGDIALYSTSSSDPLYSFGFEGRRARGSVASPTAVTSGDLTAMYLGEGYDGSAYRTAGGMMVFADGAVSAGKVPGRLVFATADSTGISSERMRIDSAGNVGIGITPTAPLDVRVPSPGNGMVIAQFGSTATPRIQFYDENLSTGAGPKLSFAAGNAAQIAAGGNILLLPTGGKVGIINTNPSYVLDVTGVARFTGGYTTSDRRWKKNVVPIHDALDTINKLRGVTFDWRRNEFPAMHFADGRQYGFIAQDVQSVLPEIVSKDDGGYLNVSYESVIPVTVEGIKELGARLDELKADNDNLRALVEKQGREIEALKAVR